MTRPDQMAGRKEGEKDASVTGFPHRVNLHAGAVYAGSGDYTFYDDFQSYLTGDPLSSHGYGVPTGTSLTVVSDGSNKYAKQAASVISSNNRDLRSLNPSGLAYKSGWAKFWVYDPMAGSGNTDTRVGVHSSVGTTGSCLFTSGITDKNNPYSTSYWTAQVGYDIVIMDGSSERWGQGYYFYTGSSAPRIPGWSYTLIEWDIDYVEGHGSIRWYVNSTFWPNLTLDFTSHWVRWPAIHDAAGVYLGSRSNSGAVPGGIDNIEFHGNVVPEPSSALVLGSGILALAGMMRRRR